MQARDNTVDTDAKTIPGLWHQLTTQLSTLLRQEFKLARVELQQSLKPLWSSAGMLVAGVALIYAGLLLLLAAAVMGLALWMPAWLAALVLALVTSIGGAICILGSRSRLRKASLTPSHLPESLRKDKDVLLRRPRA